MVAPHAMHMQLPPPIWGGGRGCGTWLLSTIEDPMSNC